MSTPRQICDVAAEAFGRQVPADIEARRWLVVTPGQPATIISWRGLLPFDDAQVWDWVFGLEIGQCGHPRRVGREIMARLQDAR